MNIVAEIDKLITLASDLPKDGVASGPFRNGLIRIRKAFGKELETFEARISAMEADSKDKILATQNDLLSQQLHEAHEKIEGLEYDIATLKKEKAKPARREKIDEKIMLLLANGRQLTREEIMKETKLSSDAADIHLAYLEGAGMIWSRSPGFDSSDRFPTRYGLAEGGKRYLLER